MNEVDGSKFAKNNDQRVSQENRQSVFFWQLYNKTRNFSPGCMISVVEPMSERYEVRSSDYLINFPR